MYKLYTIDNNKRSKVGEGVRLGVCKNEELVEDIFGSVSEFSRQVELHGDNFTYRNIKVTYNPKTDTHTFYKMEPTPTKAKGFWLDNTGKVFIDNVIITSYSQRVKLEKGIRSLFVKGEKAVFYKADNLGYCIDNTGKKEVFKNRLLIRRLKLKISEIKNLLKKFNGLTIYNCKKTRGLYFIEVFYN